MSSDGTTYCNNTLKSMSKAVINNHKIKDLKIGFKRIEQLIQYSFILNSSAICSTTSLKCEKLLTISAWRVRQVHGRLTKKSTIDQLLNFAHCPILLCEQDVHNYMGLAPPCLKNLTFWTPALTSNWKQGRTYKVVNINRFLTFYKRCLRSCWQRQYAF